MTAPVCTWCGRTLEEHADWRRDGTPVPRVPCLLLKAHFVARAEPAPVVDADGAWVAARAAVLLAVDVLELEAVRLYRANDADQALWVRFVIAGMLEKVEASR